MRRRSFYTVLFIASFLLGGLIRVQAATGDVTLPLCTAQAHDQYVIAGPDGNTYPTWHPQVDTYFNCHFDHEHGSNPALIAPSGWPPSGSMPAYGYVTSKAGHSEGHVGFKTYVFDLSGYRWMVTHHFGTANPQIAACERFHAVDIVIMSGSTKKVDIHFMGDFGKATANQSVGNGADLTPTACPTQAADAGASNGQREIPVTAAAVAYEPWRLDSRELTALGFRSGNLVINTTDPQKACNALTCDSGVTMTQQAPANRGTRRLVTFNNDLIISGAVSGTFYTDPYGMASRTSGQSDAVKQFIAAGFSLTQAHPQDHCRIVNGTGNDGSYWCTSVFGPEEMVALNRFVTGPN